MGKKLFAIMTKEGEFVSTGRSRVVSAKPHTYTSHRNALIGLHHVQFKEGKELDIVPFVPMDDFMAMVKMCEDMFPYAGTETDVELFEKIIGKHGYGLSEDGSVCLKEDL